MSYLSNKKNQVCIENVFYKAGTLNCCLRHATSWTAFFLSYVHDLRISLPDTGLYSYEDNTCIFYQHRDFPIVENILKRFRLHADAL